MLKRVQNDLLLWGLEIRSLSVRNKLLHTTRVYIITQSNQGPSSSNLNGSCRNLSVAKANAIQINLNNNCNNFCFSNTRLNFAKFSSFNLNPDYVNFVEENISTNKNK